MGVLGFGAGNTAVVGVCEVIFTGVVFFIDFITGAAASSALSSGVIFSSATSSFAGDGFGCSAISFSGFPGPFMSGCTSPKPSSLLPRLISIKSCTTAGAGGKTVQLIKINMSSKAPQIIAV